MCMCVQNEGVLTARAKVIHQNDLLNQMSWASHQHTKTKSDKGKMLLKMLFY